MIENAIIRHVSDFAIGDLDDAKWNRAETLAIATYWNGAEAPRGRHFAVQLLWSNTGLYVRFDAIQTEPLIVSETPQVSRKTMQLWDRDVCELFLAPDAENPQRYAEFEIAPTGEWLDVMIDWTKNEPRDWEYTSGMQTFSRIQEGRVVMAMRIPWSAFGRSPQPDDVWSGNLFRCVGKGDTRGYLAWSPTMTPEPQFHVPARFGKFIFQK